jgi:hypothetical protein
MKAIAIEVKNGPAEFLAYETDEIYAHFRKLCKNSSMLYIDTEEEFDIIKETYIPLDMHEMFDMCKNNLYNGPGIYDYEGNKHPVLTDEAGTVYYIVEKYIQTTTKYSSLFKLTIYPAWHTSYMNEKFCLN